MRTLHRRGFTFVELLVVILVIVLLLGLVLPQNVRGTWKMRRERCAKNSWHLAEAVLLRAERKAIPSLPGYLQAQLIAPNSTLPNEYPNTNAKRITIAWPVLLLSELEQQAMWDQVVSGEPKAFGLDIDHPPVFSIFACPSDPQLDAKYAALSYVFNTGMPDSANPTETTPSDLPANGICHDLRPGRGGPSLELSRDVPDGLQHTLLLAENVHRDTPQSANEVANTWLRPKPGATNVEQWYGMVWVHDVGNPNAPQRSLVDAFGSDTRTGADAQRSYADEGSRFARPASHHPEVFVAAFCDGHAQVIRNDIEYRVYQQLMTPDGAKAAAVDDPASYLTEFMNPPLYASDY